MCMTSWLDNTSTDEHSKRRGLTTSVAVAWCTADGDATVVDDCTVVDVCIGTVYVTAPPVVADVPAVVISLGIAFVADVTGEGHFLANDSFRR